MSYPDGTVRQVTADLGDYSGISLTDDARIIATTQLDRHFRFADLSLSDPARMEQRGPQGIEWFSWVDDDRIVASDEDRALKMLGLSRDEITTLGTAAATWYAQPALCGPGTIVSTAINPESGMTLISKMRLDGSAANEVTHGPHDLFPTCASDGKWLIYVHIVDARDVNGTAVMRKPIDGGPAEKIVAGRNYNLSPDGKLLADFPGATRPLWNCSPQKLCDRSPGYPGHHMRDRRLRSPPTTGASTMPSGVRQVRQSTGSRSAASPGSN